MAGAPPRLTLAVCAYNEEASIADLLSAALSDPDAGHLIDEAIVVSSGSTDETDAIVSRLATAEPRVRLITEPERRGKWAAVRTAIEAARSEVILLVDADCLPASGAIAALASRLADPGVGGVGSRNWPLNASETLVARAAALMWELHHEVNLRKPVLGGDAVAFRRSSVSLPEGDQINDDFVIEAALRRQGFRIEYEPRAVIHMRAPTTVGDFVRQRRRIHAGFYRESRASRTLKATQDPRSVLPAALRLCWPHPRQVALLALLIALDSWSRVLGYYDALRGNASHSVWAPAATTKGRLTTGADAPEPDSRR